MKIKTSVKAGAGIEDERPPPNGANHGIRIRTTVKRPQASA